jgi:glutamate synthase (NADPH/NADH) large chain
MTGGRTAILGATGRNVAAGMSGGIAYVLDLDLGRVNIEMVDVETLTELDESWLRELIARHQEETGSVVAESLLVDWPSARRRISKIMPRDYKRVLEAQASAEAEGADVLTAIMEASRG